MSVKGPKMFDDADRATALSVIDEWKAIAERKDTEAAGAYTKMNEAQAALVAMTTARDHCKAQATELGERLIEANAELARLREDNALNRAAAERYGSLSARLREENERLKAKGLDDFTVTGDELDLALAENERLRGDLRTAEEDHVKAGTERDRLREENLILRAAVVSGIDAGHAAQRAFDRVSATPLEATARPESRNDRPYATAGGFYIGDDVEIHLTGDRTIVGVIRGISPDGFAEVEGRGGNAWIVADEDLTRIEPPAHAPGQEGSHD